MSIVYSLYSEGLILGLCTCIYSSNLLYMLIQSIHNVIRVDIVDEN